MSDAVTVPASYCLPLPDNIPLDIAALIEPLAVGWHAVTQSPIRGGGGENVLVLGGGPIGIAVILACECSHSSFLIPASFHICHIWGFQTSFHLLGS